MFYRKQNTVRPLRNLLFCMPFICVSIFIVGCKSGSDHNTSGTTTAVKKDDSVSLMKKKVMDLHEETMANMDTIVRLKVYLKKLRTENPNAVPNDSIETNITRLEGAHGVMMDWMHNYQELEKAGDAQKMVYFKEQLQKIQTVKAKMDESIHLAANVLKK